MIRRDHIAIGLRVLATLVVFTALAVAITSLTRIATGRAASAALQRLGRSLSRSMDPRAGDTHVELNGGWVHIRSASRSESVGDVLDEAAGSCDDGETLRDGDSASGYVLCTTGLGVDSLTDLATADFSRVGLTAFAYAERDPAGTRVVELRSDEPLSLDRLVPDGGDAPGFDLASVPRPPEVERWMSFRDASSRYQAVFYGHGRASPRDAIQWYQRRLAADGWAIETSAGEDTGGPYLVGLRERSLVVVLTDDGCDGTCVVVLSSDDLRAADLGPAAMR